MKPPRGPIETVERVGHKAHGWGEARDWDLAQSREMDADERRRVAKALRERFYGTRCPDVRDAVAGLRRRRRT
jgi:hypothetical protein